MNAQGIVDPYAAARDQLFPPPALHVMMTTDSLHLLDRPIPLTDRSVCIRHHLFVALLLANTTLQTSYTPIGAAIHLIDEGYDHKIDPQIIHLVAQNLFYGLPSESPLDHIENFEELCNTFRSSGVPIDFMMCKLFPFSLSNKARTWFKSLQPLLHQVQDGIAPEQDHHISAASNSNHFLEYARAHHVLLVGDLGDKNDVNEVLDGDTHSSKKRSKRVKKRDKAKIESVMDNSHITLVTQRCVGDAIEYKVKCKGRSKLFSKVKVILTPEFREKCQEAMDGILSTVLTLSTTGISSKRRRCKNLAFQTVKTDRSS